MPVAVMVVVAPASSVNSSAGASGSKAAFHSARNGAASSADNTRYVAFERLGAHLERRSTRPGQPSDGRVATDGAEVGERGAAQDHEGQRQTHHFAEARSAWVEQDCVSHVEAGYAGGRWQFEGVERAEVRPVCDGGQPLASSVTLGALPRPVMAGAQPDCGTTPQRSRPSAATRRARDDARVNVACAA